MSKLDILHDIIDAVKTTSTPQTQAYDTPATVTRIEGDTAWVHIPGGVDETPVKLTIAAKAGDTVQLRVGGGTAWLVGNRTAPPTDDTTADKAIEKAKEAGKTATDYVTDTSDGLFVHPRKNMGDGVRIKKVIEILRGGRSVAEYGDTVRVGEVGKGHVVIDGQNFHIFGEGGVESARIGADEGTGSIVNVLGSGNSVELNENAEAVVLVTGSDNNVVDGFVQIVILGSRNTVDGNGVAIGSDNELHGNGAAIGDGIYYDYETGGSGETISPPIDGQPLIIGCYNRKTSDQGDYAFIIGNGSGENDRKDAFKVDWNGGLYSDTRKLFATGTATATVTVVKGATEGFSVPIGKTGYTPWAINGFQISSASCNLYSCYISGTNLVGRVYNPGTSGQDLEVTVTARISYIAKNAL
jgi:hypothetical protein